MIGWTVKWTIISLVLIILVHYLYSFFIDTLTVPKVKDLIHNPSERYNQIITNTGNKNNQNTEPDPSKMNEELRDFLSNIKKGEQQKEPVSAISETSAYSSY